MEQYITFRLADKVLMSQLSLIEEVTDPLPVTSIAGTQSWFQGLASKKGRLLPVSDLGEYAISKPSRYDAGAKWLIVKRDAETIGLIVDEVIGLTESNQQQVNTTQSQQNSDLNDTPLSALVIAVMPVDANARDNDTRTNNARTKSGADKVDTDTSGHDEVATVVDLGRLLTQQRFIQIGTPII